jgi:hypothetical protein
VPLEGSRTNPRTCYIGDRSPFANYYASPLYAPSFADLPPLLIHGGNMETLRDEIVLLASRIGPTARLSLFDHQPHVFQFFVGSPAAQASFADMAAFLTSLPAPAPSHFDLSALDASLQRLAPAGDEKPPKAVTPPQHVFEPSSLTGIPRPTARASAAPELQALVEAYVEPARATFFAPRRLRAPPTLFEGVAHL